MSIAVHVLIVLLLVTPFAMHPDIIERAQGAGGAGPAGGGGGGHGGTGGLLETERLQYIAMAPAAAPAPVSAPVEQVQPPTPAPPQPPKIVETAKVATSVTAITPATVPDMSAIPGAGGGSGRDGTNGSGPGTGGGVGTGTGTGRGSAVGPGTGGGTQENYPATLQEMPIPPLPVPSSLRGTHVVAEFDVDSTGRVLAYEFSRTKDGDYNRKLDDVFRRYTFKPGATPDGRPIRMKVQIVIDL
jgi:hypothetical protein